MYGMIKETDLRSLMLDVCEAYWCYYALWHSGGLTKRCLAKGRSISGHLEKMQFHPAYGFSLNDLSDFGAEIYAGLLAKYETEKDVEEFWQEHRESEEEIMTKEEIQKMVAKGYTYMVYLQDLKEPFFFKKAQDVGPFLRLNYPDKRIVSTQRLV